MWPFKKRVKKPKIAINSKYHYDQFVYFKYRDELYFGFVSAIYLSVDHRIKYDIQVMGQCPCIVHDIDEDVMFIKD